YAAHLLLLSALRAVPRSSLVLRPPRPPISTLFPYTTLFRSGDQVEFDVTASPEAAGVSGVEVRSGAAANFQVGRVWVRPANGKLDRKSTRLNSSHGSISYAVFCLKKKIENKQKAPGKKRFLVRNLIRFGKMLAHTGTKKRQVPTILWLVFKRRNQKSSIECLQELP